MAKAGKETPMNETLDANNEPQKLVDEILELLASKEGLTVGQGAEVLEAASRQIRKGLHEHMAKQMARKVSEVFEPKSDIKIVNSIG